ncbi:MAG: metallophosphoesterase [Chthoniobacteraceae bacterium]
MNTTNQSLHASLFSRREMLRLSAGTLLALGLWPGARHADGAGNSEDFSFIAVNDLHFQSERCGPWFERVVRQMKAHEPKPAFCLMSGDWCEHGTAAEMGAARDAFKELGIPVHGVIGNHDYGAAESRADYDSLFPGEINYAFEAGGWQWLGLDTSEGHKSKGTTIQPHTLRWLAETLPKLDKKKPTVIFTHFPLGPLTPSRPVNADDLLERLIGHNLQAVFSGHFHGFTERTLGDVALTTDKCCAISRANHDGTPEKGYFLCQTKAGRLTRTFVEVKPA